MSTVRAGRASLTVLLGHGVMVLPSSAWSDDPEGVRASVDALRVQMAPVVPDDAHDALARLQQAMGAKRCMLLTFAPDGLLQKAAAADVVELGGSVWRLRCASDQAHPRIGVFGPQDPHGTCATCGGQMRPDMVLAGDAPEHVSDAHAAVSSSKVLLVVDADPEDELVQALLASARAAGTQCWEVRAPSTPDRYDETLPQPGHEGLPRLVRRWLQEDVA